MKALPLGPQGHVATPLGRLKTLAAFSILRIQGSLTAWMLSALRLIGHPGKLVSVIYKVGNACSQRSALLLPSITQTRQNCCGLKLLEETETP